MSQIAHIMIAKKLQEQIRFWRKFGNSPRAEVPGVLLEQIDELMKHQAETIKAMDRRIVDLMELLPEDALDKFTSQVVSEMQWGDENED